MQIIRCDKNIRNRDDFSVFQKKHENEIARTFDINIESLQFSDRIVKMINTETLKPDRFYIVVRLKSNLVYLVKEAGSLKSIPKHKRWFCFKESNYLIVEVSDKYLSSKSIEHNIIASESCLNMSCLIDYIKDKELLLKNIFIINREEIHPCTNFDEKMIEFFDEQNDDDKITFDGKISCFISKTKNDTDNMFLGLSQKLTNMLRDGPCKCVGDTGYFINKQFGPSHIHTYNLSRRKKATKMNVVLQVNHCTGSKLFFPQMKEIVSLKKGEIVMFPSCWTHNCIFLSPEGNSYSYYVTTELL